LHSGPERPTGQPKAVEEPRLKKLVEGGELEVVGDYERPVGGLGGASGGEASCVVHTS